MDARDNQELFDWEKEPCNHCGKYKTYEGHDGCIGELNGVANACCGHDNVDIAYVQFYDGFIIWGEDAIKIQEILKRNKYNKTLDSMIEFLEGAVRFLKENQFSYFENRGVE